MTLYQTEKMLITDLVIEGATPDLGGLPRMRGLTAEMVRGFGSDVKWPPRVS